ncbi:MAG: hypothetical protein AAF620_18750 [Bacteroidota bacterium]
MKRPFYFNFIFVVPYIMILLFASCDLGLSDEDEDDISSDLTGEYVVIVLGESFFGSADMNVSKNSNSSVIVSLVDTGYPEIIVGLSRLTNGNIGLTIEDQFSGNFSIRGRLLENSEFNGAYALATSEEDEQFFLFPIIEVNGVIDSVAITGSFK